MISSSLTIINTQCRQTFEEEMTINFTRMLVITVAAVTLAACHSKKKQEEQEFIPPGYYVTRAEAQTRADRLNADLANSIAKEKAAGVAAKNLPCGHYKVISKRNTDGVEFWRPQFDRTGCTGRSAFPSLPTLFISFGGKTP